jgi:hypothetical protein
VTGAALLARARAAGAVLAVADGRVVVDGASRLAPDLLASLRAYKADLLAILTANAVSEPFSSPIVAAVVPSHDPPSVPCRDCGHGVWWRVSVLSGGPGPWHCERCQPPDPDTWRDACACPVTAELTEPAQ